MKTLMKPLIAATLALSLLSACDPTTFNQEAGSGVDEGGFGNATMINTLSMISEQDATRYLQDRFAAEVSPVINFEFNRAELTPEAQTILARQASWIKRFPEVRFSVYGHTDLVGTERYNKGLGLRRAQAAVSYLVGQGISPSRLVALVSYGETRPVVQTQAPEVRNRRAVTGVQGFAKGYTGLLNGKYAAIIMREYVESATRPHVQNTDVKSSVTSPASGG